MEQAVRARAAARGWMTRACKALEAVCVEAQPDRVTLVESLADFDSRMQSLDTTQAAVELEIDLDKLEEDIEAAADLREKARLVRTRATKLLAKLSNPEDIDHVSNHGNNEGRESEAGSFGTRSAKLPKLELPKFRGEVTEWQSFWDKFGAVVHNSDLPVISKFTYLQSLLEGEAKAAIQGLSITAQHYKIACDILEKRFGRKERIIFAHIQGLLNVTMPSQGKSSSVSMLWKLQDELLKHTRSLEALGVEGEQYGLFLTPLILSRLPNELRLEWARDGEGKESDLKWLLDFVRKEIERRERSEVFREVTPKGKVDWASEEKRSVRTPTTSALRTSSSDANNCAFCRKSHMSEKCLNILEVDIPERHERIKSLGLCFRCLGVGHLARGCFAKCAKCQGRHHQLCCYGNSNTKPKETQTVKLKSDNRAVSNFQSDTVSRVGVSCSPGNKLCTVLQTAKVLVSGEKGSTEVTLMFDTGSDNSYITSSLVRKVGPKWLSATSMSYSAFGEKTPTPSKLHNVYKVDLQGLNGECGSLKVVEVKAICSPMCRPTVPHKLLQSLDNLELADNYAGTRELSVDILVGVDAYWDFVKQGVIKLPEGIVAQETVFGWIISGAWHGNEGFGKKQSLQLLCLNDIPESTLRNFWDLETIGINSEESNIIDPVLQGFNDTIKFSDGRYEVSLPWKSTFGPLKLLNNEKLAMRRLVNLSRKFARDPELKLQYDKSLADMEVDQIITEVPPEEKLSSYPVYYMPHHPVIKESSLTTKVRPVFDASAPGFNGVSLNDCLQAGPSLIPNLVEILIRFRRWPVVLTTDITKAFLQIKVSSQDQEVHRFLWDCNGSIRVMKFLRVPFGNKSSPFLLNATIRYHLSKYPPSRAVEELKENLYVDDLLTGADSENEVCKLYQEARSIMKEAGMPLAKCTSNNQVVSDMLFQEFGAKHLGIQTVKILGLKWSTHLDCFSFEGLEIPTNLVTTKRVVLSFLARLYDPLGFLVPFTMTAKILIQEIWQLGLDWDTQVPQDIQSEFLHWVQGLESICYWEIPRCYSAFPWASLVGLELHGFGDASEKAYGAVVYLRIPCGDGTFKVSFVTSRARVAPLKKVTLPRLELLAALMTARLIGFVRQALRLPEVGYRCWTDSMVTLGWVKGDPGRWKPFIANRVAEIQDLTSPNNWGHWPGDDNPADLVTRGLAAEKLVSSKLWLEGPMSLAESIQFYPANVALDGEVTVGNLYLANVVIEPKSSSCFKVDRWGKFIKAIRVVSWVLRFIGNLKCSLAQRQVGDLTYEEIAGAKLKLFVCIQQAEYPDEIKALKQGQSIHRGSPLAKLNPFISKDALLRIKGRLQESVLPYQEKHPIILPKGHLTKLLVEYQHRVLKHAGVNTVVSSLRNEYWIIGLRRLVKTVKRECVSCQRVDSRACNQPVAPLPDLRVTQAPPFSVTGMDYAGPLFCCDHPGKKLYILLFTCAVIRAVHLELTDSLSLADFLLAFRRFVARRGLPSTLYTDNAKTFQGAATYLLKVYGPTSPKWKFIVPRSPWWGGWWERLVRSVKSALKKSVGGCCLSRCETETTLLEIEACINSRPLTFVSDEFDCSRALTPSHFLIGKHVTSQLQLLGVEEVVSKQVLTEKEGLRQSQLDLFWFIWNKDYLRNLPPAVNKFRNKGAIRKGSVVLIREDNTPRMKWPLGLVVNIYPGRDGVVRSVQLKTNRGSVVRSIQRLHELEIYEPPPDDSGDISVNDHSETDLSPSQSIVPIDKPRSKPSIKPFFPREKSLRPDVRVTRTGRISKPVEKLNL